MSSTVLVALITGGSTAAVGIAGLASNAWSQWQERKQRLEMERMRQEEQYRIALYDKRLEVHQQAYKWLMDLILPLRNVIGAKEDDFSTAMLSLPSRKASG